MPVSQPERVAIIGGGCTGITSFWALQNSDHDVHLFEASDALGGRIKSLPFEHDGIQVKVNSESPIYNVETSPNLDSLLRCLGISTTSYRFSVRTNDGASSSWWSDSILRSILLRPWVLSQKETYAVLRDIIWLRFLAIDVLDQNVHSSRSNDLASCLSAQSYLSKEGYSDSFRDRYLAPILSVLWGTNAGKLLSRLPVKVAIRCLYDHQLLWYRQNVPEWRRIELGAHHLVQVMSRDFDSSKVHLDARVRQLTRYDKRLYRLVTADGIEMDFDRIIFAVDGEEIMQILGPQASAQERKIIGGLGTTKNISVLHSDSLVGEGLRSLAHAAAADGWGSAAHHLSQLLRDRERPTAVYNYMLEPYVTGSSPNSAFRKSSLSYTINALEDTPASLYGPIYITLNPFTPPHPSVVQSVWEFTNPEPTSSTLRAQDDLKLIQNQRGLSYGFRWTGRGHLEDAVTAGLRIAIEDLNAEVPFHVEYQSEPFAADLTRPSLGLSIQIIRTLLRILQFYILILALLIPMLPGPVSRLIARYRPTTTSTNANKLS
ncbi:uncharacterized protein BO97DRAFT_427141 [Aspergillus homomorphus CBS 101889]|uniref:FAD/NAD(P)-binding domain-containing protein n=1 Tax=Aspergillus homomorphus (strain CBS 101889) TaxID=1450537 RepID=A0A395HPP4_ASPHC|nr:FAD/NAD(P)-binding domain-containing protein [Aspergillus homomorphus CBS 101889]RAL09720.1 FAD/NAD(P)-binding domain-containing protein [Aspergillus homomorphus CBS 101889]